jgi:hypothetical protein
MKETPESGHNEFLFHARPSNGRYWAGGTGLITLLLFVIPVLLAAFQMSTPGVYFFVIPMLVLGLVTSAPMLIVAWYAPSMHYILTDDELALKCNRLIADRISLEDIRSVRVHEKLKISILASFRFPGLAMFDVDYADVNRVRMCATSASQRILLIETDRKRYGVTPADVAAFLSSLQRRLDNPSIVEFPERTSKVSKIEAAR